MLAIHCLKDLLGPSGYRIYATSIDRQPTTFNRSVSTPTVTSRIVKVTCAALRAAEDHGADPKMILGRARHAYFPGTENKSGLQAMLESQLGPDVVLELATLLDVTTLTIKRALEEGARQEPHFKILALALEELRKRSAAPSLEFLSYPEPNKKVA
jgi:hypothetical protein